MSRVRTQLWLAAAILGGLLGAPAPARAGPNLLKNSTFGTNSFQYWTYTPLGTLTSAAVVIQTNNVGNNYPTGAYGEAIPIDPLTTGSPTKASGYAAYFSTDTGSETLSQSIALAPGSYAIGFDVFVPQNGFGNPKDATLSAQIAGTTVLAATSVAAIATSGGVATWLTISSQAQIATAGTYLVDFTFTGEGVAAKDILVDRVYLTALSIGSGSGTPVPEPAAATLLGAGAVVLALVRRRRQAR